MVITLLLVTLALGSLMVITVWVTLRDVLTEDDGSSRPGDSATQDTVASRTTPNSLEGVLVVQLADGAISRRQYVHAMELLAERDADRHPLSVPPDV